MHVIFDLSDPLGLLATLLFILFCIVLIGLVVAVAEGLSDENEADARDEE